MTEWWTYRPEDFLLFSARTYWRMFELHNAALWPLPLAGPVLGALFLLIAWRRPEAGRWIVAVLAILWALVGWSFVWSRYANINWAATWLAPLFPLEALLLLGAAFVQHPLTVVRHGPATAVGLALVAVAVAYPLVAPLGGRPWGTAEIFGLAPDPTAIGTLGFALLLAAPRWMVPIPVLWCLLSGATLLTMGATEAWLPLGAAAASVFVAFVRRRRPEESAQRSRGPASPYLIDHNARPSDRADLAGSCADESHGRPT